MTMAAEIKSRVGPASTAGDRSGEMKINPGTAVKSSSGGCC